MSIEADTQTDTPQIWAVVPAAGVGSRMAMETPKQYLEIAGRTVLAHTLDALAGHDRIIGVVVAIRSEDNIWSDLNYRHQKLIRAVEGGSERIHSVLNALEWLSVQSETGNNDWVMVHDAARPCVSSEEIDGLIEAALGGGAGAILGQPINDTLKKVNQEADRILETVDRNLYWRAQTPQLFPLQILLDALRAAVRTGNLATDESAAMEAMGFQPVIVPGQPSNIKITTLEDLQLANYYLGNLK